MGIPRVQYAIRRFILCALALLSIAEATYATPPAPNATKPGVTPVRIALLDFVQTNGGSPRTDQDDSALSSKTNLAEDWLAVIPMLENDRVDVVVVSVNCWDDENATFLAFREVFQREFKSRFRTVAWIRTCEAACPLALLPIEEYYFYPDGVLGNANSLYSRADLLGRLISLELLLQWGEEASKHGHRDPLIFRTMLLSNSLSADIDAVTGRVTWREDEAGTDVLNRDRQKLLIGAADAFKFHLSCGTAANKEELARAMGLERVEWVGKKAAAYINMRRDARHPIVNQIQDEHLRSTVQIMLAKRASTPADVRKHADAALQYIKQLDALATEHADFFERTIPRHDLERLRTEAQRLRNWPTLRAAITTAQQKRQ